MKLVSILLALLFFSLPRSAAAAAADELPSARAGSPAARARRRFVVHVGLLVCDLYLLLYGIGACWSRHWSLWLVVGASLGSKASFLLCNHLLVLRMRRLAAETAKLCAWPAATVADERIDLGVGTSCHGGPLQGTPYRDQPRVAKLIIGNPKHVLASVEALARRYLVLVGIMYAPLVFIVPMLLARR